MNGPKKHIPAAAASALFFCAGAVFAGSAQGTGAFQFLQLGVGARPAAMGETYAGVAGDANAIYWNPAGLAGLERSELTMTHALWLEDITYSNIAYARPALGGTVGGAFNILSSGKIQEADNTGQRLADSYTMADSMGVLSYARGFGRLALGANLKFISSAIEAERARALAVDAGAQYGGLRLWGRALTLGLSVQNLGTRAKYVSESYSIAPLVRAGGALALSRRLLLVSDVNYTEKELYLHGGAEYARPFGAVTLALRAGYKNDTVAELGALAGLTAGLGVKWRDYQFDYAWNSFTDLGITHRMSLGLRFGGSDGDADGVADYLDKCPGTHAKAAVDARGCPLDSDQDGVFDGLDLCPGTPAGVVVTSSGCPVDTDGDAVADYLDKCPGTPAGVAVDAAGCPPDTDLDGVADYLDQCPETSTGVVVTSSGCPVDTDGDGVADYLDKCPGTPAGALVDSVGCPPATQVETNAMDRLLLVAMPGSVTPDVVDAVRDAAADPACPWELKDRLCMKLAMEFEYDKAELKGDFAGQLKGIAAFMAANPWAQIELQGHTDDRGTDEYNSKLSADRAKAVMDHFIEVNGLAAGRLSARGMGKAQPIVSNETEAGQQANRRVIAILSMENAP